MKLREFYEVCTVKQRLETFKKWPYDTESNLSKHKMAEAGFFFMGSRKEPDLVACFVCLKELDGWEEEDKPWEEHKSHAPHCQFIGLNKTDSELTVQDMCELNMHRDVTSKEKALDKKIKEFKKLASKTRNVLEQIS